MYKSLIYSWFLWYSIAGKFQEMKFSRISKFLFNSYYSSLFSIFELSFQVYTSHIIPRVYQIRPMSYSTVAANFTWSHPVMYLRACIIDTQHGRSQLCVYGNATLSGCWINYIPSSVLDFDKKFEDNIYEIKKSQNPQKLEPSILFGYMVPILLYIV